VGKAGCSTELGRNETAWDSQGGVGARDRDEPVGKEDSDAARDWWGSGDHQCVGSPQRRSAAKGGGRLGGRQGWDGAGGCC